MKRDPLIIALVGRAGSGKDLAAEHLVGHYGFVQGSFADSLKYMLEAHFVERGIDYAHIYEPGQKDLLIPELGVSARELMQRLGDGFRAADPDYWVKALADTLGLQLGVQDKGMQACLSRPGNNVAHQMPPQTLTTLRLPNSHTGQLAAIAFKQ